MRLDGYVRVSRVGGREGEGYISPDVQRRAIEGYAGELGGKIVWWGDDQDYSGGSTDRPGFQSILERLRGGETDGIVVMRIDRFARSVAEGASIVREITDRGQVFAACHERIDPRTPEGRYMLNSFLANAELFLDQAKASWWIAKSQAIARGVHIGPTPIGYERERSRPLRPRAVIGPAITGLFERAATGRHTDAALARWMQARAPRSMPYQSSEIRRWLRSRVYLGEVHYGALANAEAHPALTDPETWQRAQRKSGQQRKASTPFLLSGLIRCAHCRYAMGGQSHGGSGASVYRCYRSCERASVIVTSRADAHVLGLIRRRHARLVATPEGTDLADATGALRLAEDELQAFAADLEARRALGETGWRGALTLRAADRDVKAERVRELSANEQLRALTTDLDALDHHGLRDLLAGVVRHIFVRRRRGASAAERMLVVWAADPRPIDIPGPHRSGPFEPIDW